MWKLVFVFNPTHAAAWVTTVKKLTLPRSLPTDKNEDTDIGEERWCQILVVISKSTTHAPLSILIQASPEIMTSQNNGKTVLDRVNFRWGKWDLGCETSRLLDYLRVFFMSTFWPGQAIINVLC